MKIKFTEHKKVITLNIKITKLLKGLRATLEMISGGLILS
jgi:hypothetical protein